MSILNLNSPQGGAPKARKATKIWMGVGLLVAVLGVGSTFAASITLNNNQSTEFGQGVQSTVYCGGTTATLTATPMSTFKNTDSKFYLTAVQVSGIPKACNGVNFALSFYGSTLPALTLLTDNSVAKIQTPAVLWLDGSRYFPKGGSGSSCQDNPKASSTYNSSTSYSSSSDVSLVGALLSLSRSSYVSPCTYASLSNVSSDGTYGTFTINFTQTYVLAYSSDLQKIVVETQNDTLGLDTTVKPCTDKGSSKYDCTKSSGSSSDRGIFS
ncbi:hypothetical protein MCEMRE212_01048 [Candidatus Nanopelagicaceae bacterium]